MGWIVLASSRRGTSRSRAAQRYRTACLRQEAKQDFRKVVLPHPDSPTSASTSPRVTSKSTPFTAFNCCLPRNIPREIEKSRVTALALIIISDIMPPLSCRGFDHTAIPLCLALASRRATSPFRQASVTRSQRSAKRQPVNRPISEGTMPGIEPSAHPAWCGREQGCSASDRAYRGASDFRISVRPYPVQRPGRHT